jgi:hypothetical protein
MDYTELLRERWRVRMQSADLRKLPAHLYKAAAVRYARAYSRSRRMRRSGGLLLPSRRTVCAVMSCQSGDSAAIKQLRVLKKLALGDTVCVMSGMNETLLNDIRSASQATILYLPEEFDPEICRALAAKLAIGEAVLFLDDRTVTKEDQLLSFIREIERGTDVALNNNSPYMPEFAKRGAVSISRQFLNHCLKRTDLKANSLQILPHAMTRAACDTIGYLNLAVPPMAQVLAVLHGLKLRTAVSVKPARRAVSRNENTQLSDHVEAIKLLIDRQGERLHFYDNRRKRNIAERGDAHAND